LAPQPEQQAREEIDKLLALAGWQVFDVDQANIHAGRGVALREFPLNTGHGFADYLLYIDGKAAGVIEAKKAGATLTGVESQSARYAAGLPDTLPAWRRPLPYYPVSARCRLCAGVRHRRPPLGAPLGAGVQRAVGLRGVGAGVRACLDLHLRNSR
jgi:type I restriction enzyme R subunit